MYWLTCQKLPLWIQAPTPGRWKLRASRLVTGAGARSIRAASTTTVTIATAIAAADCGQPGESEGSRTVAGNLGARGGGRPAAPQAITASATAAMRTLPR